VPSVPAARRRAIVLVLALALASAGCSELDDLDELTGASPDPPTPPGSEVDPSTPPSTDTDTSTDADTGAVTQLPNPDAEPPSGPTAYPDDPAAQPCAGTDLDVRIVGFDAALGSRYLALEATNVSGRTCRVEGAPALEFGRLSGTTTPNVTVGSCVEGAPERIAVPAGQAVHAAVSWNAMSTALDPDVTVEVRVQATSGGGTTVLALDKVLGYDGTPLGQLDVLDGAEVGVGWWQVSPQVWERCLW